MVNDTNEVVKVFNIHLTSPVFLSEVYYTLIVTKNKDGNNKVFNYKGGITMKITIAGAWRYGKSLWVNAPSSRA